MMPELKPGERLDDLQCDGLKLIQRPDAFRRTWAAAPGPSRC